MTTDELGRGGGSGPVRAPLSIGEAAVRRLNDTASSQLFDDAVAAACRSAAAPAGAGAVARIRLLDLTGEYSTVALAAVAAGAEVVCPEVPAGGAWAGMLRAACGRRVRFGPGDGGAGLRGLLLGGERLPSTGENPTERAGAAGAGAGVSDGVSDGVSEGVSDGVSDGVSEALPGFDVLAVELVDSLGPLRQGVLAEAQLAVEALRPVLAPGGAAARPVVVVPAAVTVWALGIESEELVLETSVPAPRRGSRGDQCHRVGGQSIFAAWTVGHSLCAVSLLDVGPRRR